VCSSQALPGYLITTPPSVCVPDVIGALTVWIQNQKKLMAAWLTKAKEYESRTVMHSPAELATLIIQQLISHDREKSYRKTIDFSSS